jgi:hypothetical protein
MDEDFVNFLEDFCDFLNAQEATIAKLKAQIAKLVGAATPGVGDVEKFPWKPFKEGHRAGWIFADLPEVKDLLKAIKAQPNQKLRLGEYEYKISYGKGKTFISRYPIK